MFTHIRTVFRLLLFAVVTVFTVLLVGLGNLFLSPFGDVSVGWKNKVIRQWARATKYLSGMKLDINGIPPDPPFFLVCNHLSYMDVVPLWECLDATFIAKSEVSEWPFFGKATRILGVLFINRELKSDVRRVNKLISASISGRQGLILFPEGTSTKGEEVLTFHSSLLFYPAINKMPVHYASITYQTDDDDIPASERICWWGDMAFLSHLYNLFRMSGFKANLTFGKIPVFNSNRKKLAENLHKKVEEIFEPVES